MFAETMPLKQKTAYFAPRYAHTIQVIRRNQQLQAQLRRNLHVRNILALCILLIVVKILADLLQHDPAAAQLEITTILTGRRAQRERT